MKRAERECYLSPALNTLTPMEASMSKAHPTSRKPRPFTDLTGQTFGRWFVLEHLGLRYRRNPRYSERYYLCRCDCGTESEVLAPHLISGRSTGCRVCWRIQHGAAKVGNRMPEFDIWMGMLSRCHYASNAFLRKNYGARGIRVCRRWRESFTAFFEDMGSRPSPELSIDRRDNNGHYSCGHCPECLENGWPSNCRWATRAEQARNTRTCRNYTHDGTTLNLSQWARQVGLALNTLSYRLAQGMSFPEAISTPRRRGRRPKPKP